MEEVRDTEEIRRLPGGAEFQLEGRMQSPPLALLQRLGLSWRLGTTRGSRTPLRRAFGTCAQAGSEAGAWLGIQRLTRASAALQSTDAGMQNKEGLQGLLTQTSGLDGKA